MRKVAANAFLLMMALGCSAIGARVLIAESDAFVNVVADGLHAVPAWLGFAEEGPGEIGKSFGIAVAARQEKLQRSVGESVDLYLRRSRCNDVRFAAVVDREVAL